MEWREASMRAFAQSGRVRAAVIVSSAVLPVVLGSAATAQEHAHTGTPGKLGKVEFEVTCAAEVQPKFERAVAMLHSFWFDAADAAFKEINAADPNCAMAYWGTAVTLQGNPMTRVSPSPAALQQGLAAAERARELVGTASHREQMYVDAVLSYYRDHATRDHATRMKSLEEALQALHRMHSEDMEAAIFYARTLVANAPPSDQTFAKQLQAAEIMQALFDRHPDHPGLAHYLIHAYDAPSLAARATHAAKAYSAIAPAAPHALHMPSHIFTRLGHWDESIEMNTRSARAEPDSNAAVHPLDYMVYAYLQQGRDADAQRVVARAVSLPDRFYVGLLGYNFVAMPARYAVERNDWKAAAALKLPAAAAPHTEAVTRFARAVGAARSGQPEQARTEVAALVTLRDALRAQNDAYWATIVEAQRLGAQAWITFATGDTQGALRTAREAAELEETVEKHPVTPGPILPARELLGDLLLKAGNAAEAQQAYEKTLEREPRRARTLFGAARAAEKAGAVAQAQRHYRELLQVMEKGDPTRPELQAAKQFLQRTSAKQ
jgi:tetratricopeptide (TPR) repeat protein